MRRISVFNRVTPEGYFAKPDGATDWFVLDDELDKEGEKGIATTDTILFGRRTFEMFAKFWPHALDESASDPHAGRRLSPAMRAMALFLNETPKLVFSKTLKHATWRNTRIIHDVNPDGIRAMKQQPGKNMIVFGSGALVSQLTQHGLIDEYQLVMSPVLLGQGKPLFADVATATKLRLAECRAFRSGNVLLRYERATA